MNPITGPSRGSGVRQSARRQRTPDVLTIDEIREYWPNFRSPTGRSFLWPLRRASDPPSYVG
jgi:hypothetical protein